MRELNEIFFVLLPVLLLDDSTMAPVPLGAHLHPLEGQPAKVAKMSSLYLEEEKTESRKQVLL